MENLELWDRFKTPPKDALKQIKGGRLRGMTDISPQWRMQALTELFGPIGFGWYYTVDNKWLEAGSDEVVAFADISLFVKYEDEWSKGIVGSGGSKFIANEKNGLYTSDEVYKMAITDALSVACKSIGIASDIYRGLYDGSKYNTPEPKIEIKKGDKNQQKNYNTFVATIGELDTIKDVDDFLKDNADSIKKAIGGTELIDFLKEDVTKHKTKILEAIKQLEEANE